MLTRWSCTIRNVATPGPGGDCTSEATCTTDHTVPPLAGWTLAKTADPASGTPVDTVGLAGLRHHLHPEGDQPTAVDATGAKAEDNLPADVTVVKPLAAGLTLSTDGEDPHLGHPASGGRRTAPSRCPTRSPSTTRQRGPRWTTWSSRPPRVALQPRTLHDDTIRSSSSSPRAAACVLDAAYLEYTITTKNVPNASNRSRSLRPGGPQDGTVVKVDTIPAGQGRPVRCSGPAW